MLYLMQALRLGREYNNAFSSFRSSFSASSSQTCLLFISSAKRFYDSARPITAIQCLYEGETVKAWRGPYQGVGDMSGSDWMPVSRYIPCHLFFVFAHWNETHCSLLFRVLHTLDYYTVSRSLVCHTSFRRICFRALHVQCCLGFCSPYIPRIGRVWVSV
jgi:hypothetical protein